MKSYFRYLSFSIFCLIVLNYSTDAQTIKKGNTYPNSITPPISPEIRNNYFLMGFLYNDPQNSSSVKLWIRKPKTPCALTAKFNSYRIYMTNMSYYKRLGKFLVWKMEVVNCNNELVIRNISIDLTNLNKDGFTDGDNWEFESQDYPLHIYDIKFSPVDAIEKDVVIGKYISAPDSISGKSYAGRGEKLQLSVVGGNLSLGSKWFWYEGGCQNGQPKDSGITANIKLLKTTTFYVCSVKDGIANSSCISKTITVNDSSYAALKIIGNKQRVCPNENNKQKLTISGGHLGLGAKWVWYKDDCEKISNKLPDTGEEIEVDPSNSVTYFVRAEGTINTTSCVEFRIEMMENSVSPKELKADNPSICQDQPVKLNIIGGKLASDAQWQWFQKVSSSNSKKSITEYSDRIIQYPREQTEYFVQAKGYCNTSSEVSTIVNVTKKTIMPLAIMYTNPKSYKKFILTLNGGKLGEDNAKWVWLVGADKYHTGVESEISFTTKKAQTITVYAEGDCGKLNESVTLPLYPNKPSNANSKSSKLPTWNPNRDPKTVKLKGSEFINLGILFNPAGSSKLFVATFSSKNFYVRTKFSFNPASDKTSNTSNSEYTCDDNGLTNFNGVSNFNGMEQSKRSSFTFGYTLKYGSTNRKEKKKYLYFGLGYGKRELLWGVNIYRPIMQSNTWATNTLHSFKGIETEAGLLIKVGGFNIMSGISIISSSELQSTYTEGNIGVGINLNK